MGTDIKLILIDYLIATIVTIIGLMISKTFIFGMICGVIYWLIADLIESYYKEREEK